MKIGVPLLVLGVLQCFASNGYAQNARLNISVKNETLEHVLSQIEAQSDFLFFYNIDEIDKNAKVTIDKTDSDIKEVLDAVVSGRDLTYAIRDRHIVLIRTPKVLSQQIPVTGTIVDDYGDPMPGVNVTVKGTSIGVVTDINGHYSINVPGRNSVLMFSFVGYTFQEIPVDDRNVVDVTLMESAQELEEVVVIGYGTARRGDLTGSISSVSAAQLKDIPVTSVAQAIVGRMPGVQVTQTEGSPDAEIKIRVRGGGSITQDNSPLYIVDGFPMDDMNDIAPTDIQSIDVLKDASSTAIYGARGANGVVIITTKSGFEGKAKVRYNAYYGISKTTHHYDVMEPYDFVKWQWELRSLQANDIVDEMEKLYGAYDDMWLYKDISGTDWQEEVLGRTGTTLSNNLSVSGGTKTIKYNVSYTRSDVEAIMVGSGQIKTNLTAKTNFQINDWLSLDMNLRLTDTKIKGGGTTSGARLNHIVQYRPTNGISDFWEDDGPEDEQYSVHPLKQTNDDYRRQKNQTFNYDGAVNIKLFPSLTYRVEVGYAYTKLENKRFYGLNTSNAKIMGERPLTTIRKDDKVRYREASTLTFNKRDIFAPGHNLTVMVGQEIDRAEAERIENSATNFPKYIDPVSAFAMQGLGKPDNLYSFIDPIVTTVSFFGRLNYDYAGKYLFNGVLRTDGSSKFAPGARWGVFPSASVGWRISEEQFMQNTRTWLADLKFRASFGAAGNNRIANNAWRLVYSMPNQDMLAMDDYTTTTPVYTIGGGLPNWNLKWETTYTRNLGLDFALFKGRLNGTFELYHNTTKDLLIQAAVPANTGYTTMWQNVGQTSNKGVEISLSAIIAQGRDFQISANFNIGFNKNNVDKLGEVKQMERASNWSDSNAAGNDYIIMEGSPVGQMYGYVTDGMYTRDDFVQTTDVDANGHSVWVLKEGVANSAAILGSRFISGSSPNEVPRPGSLKLKKQNNDPEDAQTDVVNLNDRVVIGDANPKHTGGFGVNAQYKGFDFSVFFNWVYGNNIYNANKIEFSQARQGRLRRNLLDNMSERYTYFDPQTMQKVGVNDFDRLDALNPNPKMWSPAFSNGILHSWAVEDGSFLRLNNLTIGYSLPSSLLSRIKIEQLRIYVTGYNLWIWTNYSGYDPEVDTQRSTPLTPGVDYNAYPRSRSFNIGLNLTF